MGKLSPEKQAQLDALEAERDAAEDDDDDDDYAWVRLASGATVRLHGKRLNAYLKKHGLDDDAPGGDTQSDPIEPGSTPAKKTAPAKKPAKKAAAAAPADDDESAEEELAADAEPARRRPVFF